MLLTWLIAAVLGAAPQSTNANVWQRARDYLRLEGAVDAPRVRIELTIDANGEPIHCSILKSDEAKGFDDRFCTVPMRRARFRPARDENGQSIASVFATNFSGETAAQHRGPDTMDYVLTVNRLPAGRARTVTTRVVTDAAGHVESCAIDSSSGVDQLDEAACRYTRSSLTLAAPFDRDGRPVRAMRVVRIGFTSGDKVRD